MNTRNRPAGDTAARTGTQSLQRAAALLRGLVASRAEGATAVELAARASLDRTTVHRMLRCLAAEGLAAQDARTRRYFLGPLAYEMGLAAAERTDLRALCRPVLARIAGETGDTAFLMIRSGDESACVERAEGPYPVKTLVVDVGTRRPLGIGAGSLAILGALPPEEAEEVLARNAGRLGAYDRLTVARLRRMMRQARADGHVTMGVVDVPGVRAVAVPIRDATGRAVAAFSLAAVEWRMTQARCAELLARLRDEASRVGERLGAGA